MSFGKKVREYFSSSKIFLKDIYSKISKLFF